MREIHRNSCGTKIFLFSEVSALINIFLALMYQTLFLFIIYYFSNRNCIMRQDKNINYQLCYQKRARTEKKIILEAPAYSGLIQGLLQIWTEHAQTDL